MSVNAVSWAIDRAPVPGARCVARMILVHLADKADAEGRDTWKYVSAIADAIGVDDSTVHRNLAWLEEHGLIERGDQRLVDDYPDYARPVVWNLRLDRVREPSGRETKKRRAGRPRKRVEKPGRDSQPGFRTGAAGVEKPGCDLRSGIPGEENPVAPVQPGWSRPCNQGGCTRAIQNVHTHPETFNPSAPSGHLPASGESHDDDSERACDADAGRVADEIVRRRRLLGLSAPEPGRRDRAAVRRLLDVLAADGLADPVDRVLSVVDFAMRGDWWPKRLRSGRNLAALWEQIVDDMRLAGAAGGADAGHTHTSGCRHVAGVVDSPTVRAVEPLTGRRWEHADLVARMLVEGMGPEDAAEQLASLLRETARRHEEDMAELARLRAARGGRMFAGHGMVESEVAA